MQGEGPSLIMNITTFVTPVKHLDISWNIKTKGIKEMEILTSKMNGILHDNINDARYKI